MMTDETNDENEIFSLWKPTKQMNNVTHHKHPSTVFESERLSCVALPKNEIELNIKTHHDYSDCSIISNNFISDIQIESISYAIKCFEDKHNILNRTRGFLLGDGTGLGKSRSISGIIAECFIRNPVNFRAIWVSLNQKLEKTMKEEYKINETLGNMCPRWVTFDNFDDFDDIDDENDKGLLLYVTYSNFLNNEKFLKILKFLNTNNILLIFDESHQLKNKNSQTSKRIMQLQDTYENPRVLYSTATSASNVRQMHYMSRLGLFEDHTNFVRKLEYYGNAAMEMSAIQLKYSGHMISRQLGLHDIKIKVDMCKITKSEQRLYEYLSDIFFQKRYEISSIDTANFYQYLISSIKMKHLVAHVRTKLSENKSIVIGLNSTCDGHKSPLYDLLLKYGIESTEFEVENMLNPIDYFVNEFGVDNVSEISGRSMRLIFDPTTNSYETQKIPSTSNEIDAFQLDKKQIAIITRAGNAGISLHSSTISSRQRYHILFEIPKSADLVVQQIGRTYRTTVNTHKPMYSIFISNIPAEMRYVFGVTSKLEKLGALTKGDKRASVLNNVEFNGCTSISKCAYDSFMLDININIAKNWYNTQRQTSTHTITEFDLVSIRQGLSAHTRTIRSNTYTIFTKILSNLNDYIIDNDRRSLIHHNNLQYISLNLHGRYWMFIFKGMLNNLQYNLTDKILFGILIVIFEQLEIYVPNTKFENFSILERWTKKNHTQQSPYVKSVVKTLLLCRNTSECQNTLGKLPTDIFYTIIPYLTHNNNILKKISVNGTISFRNEIYKPRKMNYQNILLNNLFDMKIDLQRILFSQLRYHVAKTKLNQRNCKYILHVDEYILKSNVNDYDIIYDSFEKRKDDYELSLSLKRKTSIDDLNRVFFRLKQNLISYVRKKTYKTKFGMLISVENKSHTYEIWYPGRTKPSHVYLEYQLENIRNHYIFLSSSMEDDWDAEVESVLSRHSIVQYRYKLLLSVETAIKEWSNSHGVLLKVQNTGICRDFVGLLRNFRKFT